MKMTKIHRFAVHAALISAALTAGGAAAQDAGVKTITIGFAGPLTGQSARTGKDMSNAVRLAIEEANAKKLKIGGSPVKFELMEEDDQSDPKTATQVAQRLVDAKVAGVVGHYNSGCSIPASKIYSSAGIPQITPSSTNPKYSLQGYKTTFRTIGHDGYGGAYAGRYAVANMRKKSIVVIDDRTAFGQGLADEFANAVKANGGTIVGREYTSDKATDFSTILTSAKAKNVDLIFFGGLDVQAAAIARQMKGLGMGNVILFGASGVVSQTFLDLAQKEGDGVISFEPGLPIEHMPGGKEFDAKYKAKYKMAMDSYAPFAYDAANALIEAMKKANSAEPAKYLPELSKIKFTGVTGVISFDAHGDIMNPPYSMYRAEGGKWQFILSIGDSKS